MKHMILSIAAIILFCISAPTTHAYVTTGQGAFTVDGKTAVYTINFVFGHKNYDVYIPMHAFSGDATSTHTLTYTFKSTADPLLQHKSVGIVLSSAHMQDGMYVVKKGTQSTFTLLVLDTPTKHGAGADSALAVTYLPFTFNRIQQLQLNPSELEHYVTPAVHYP
jgi:hypothetical protein